MTSDRNLKAVQFIQPNVLDRACLSISEHDGFADQFRLRCTVLIQKALTHGVSPMAARPCQPSRLCYSGRLNGDACPNSHPLE
jgi:hypothetical protein